MNILSVGQFYQPVSDELSSLKGEVKAACGRHIRRIDRFIQLAIIGAFRCVEGANLQKKCGLYLASGDGPKENIHESLQSIHRDGVDLTPFNFINLVSNASSFYVAQALALDAPNIFISTPQLALYKALALAERDLKNGVVEQALVGCVDEAASPLSIQKEKLGVASGDAVGEGSYWFLLSLDAQGAIAYIDTRDLLRSDSNNKFFIDIGDKDLYSLSNGQQVITPGQSDEGFQCLNRHKGFESDIAPHRSISAATLACYLLNPNHAETFHLLDYDEKKTLSQIIIKGRKPKV